MYEELCKDRSRDININLGAGSKEETLELYVAGGLSTFDKGTAEANNIFLESEKKISVKIKPLTDIINENINTKNTEIHFCKIDVENFEKEVLKGIDLDSIRPWIFSIESTIPYTKIPTYTEWEDILLDNGYYLLCNHGVSRYYADKSKKKMFENKNFEKLKDSYEIYYVLEKSSKAYAIVKFIRKHIISLTDLYYRIRHLKIN